MQPLFYVKKLGQMLRDVAAKTDYSPLGVLWAYGLAFLRCGSFLDEFRICRLYDCSGHVQARHFMTSSRAKRVAKVLDRGATKEEFSCFEQKDRFNAAFADYIRRDWIFTGDCTREELRGFLDRNDTFLAKETGGTQGKQITRWHAGEYDPEAFLDEHIGREFVLEAIIRQHPKVAALNPTSVNTVRLVTARYLGKTLVLGGCLRAGGANAFVDNFHNGGVAYPLNIETGVVCGPGLDFEANKFVIHPATGEVVLGFAVPHWEEAIAAVTEAAAVIPHVGYVGWDVAITEDGVEFVEGNVSYPDPAVIQLDRNDAWKRLREFMRECEASEK